MRLLIGVDGSAEAGHALELVHALALRAADEIILAAIAEVPLGFETLAGPPTTLAWHGELRDAVLQRCRGTLERAAGQAWSPAAVTSVLAEGHPLQELLLLARDRKADAVVVGPHGLGRIESLIIGSVSQGLLHAGTAPVVVARPIVDSLHRVVVGVDGSQGSRAAIDWLASLPLPLTTEIIVLAVLPAHTGPFGRAWSDELYPDVVAIERAAATDVLEDAMSRLRVAGRTVTSDIRSGPPKVALVEAARDLRADLLVVGARGLGGFEGLVLGSVSRAVAKTAACSVAVIQRRHR
jgi:nucleotide-binding universal stress UspA family protein